MDRDFADLIGDGRWPMAETEEEGAGIDYEDEDDDEDERATDSR